MIIVIGISGSAWVKFQGVSGSSAVVYVKEKRVAVFNLSDEVQIKQVETPIGQIHIQYGEENIRILKSPCPQKICLLQGAIQQTHEQIICVPAHLYIRIINPKQSAAENTIDAISY